MSLSGICQGLVSAVACLIGTCIIGEIGYRQYNAMTRFDELPVCPLNQHGVPLLHKLKSAAVFLYNASVDEHHEFLHDVGIANSRHAVTVYQLECTTHRSVCGMYGHGQVHEYEEPPVMFFHKGEWSESYHDDLQQGFIPKPKDRQQRVKAIVKWLDAADARGADKIFEREQKISEMNSMLPPSKRMMREAIKKAEEEKKKRDAGKKAEL